MTGSIRSIGTTLALASLTAVIAAQGAPKMNVKMGLWEMTSTMTMSGDMPGMPDMSKMTPEQQERVKAAMAAMTAKPMTNTVKSCLTKEKFEKGELGEGENCTQTLVANTSSAYDVKVTCKESNMTTAGTMHLEAPTPEAVNGKINMQSTGQGKTMTINGTITGKWLGADCGSIK